MSTLCISQLYKYIVFVSFAFSIFFYTTLSVHASHTLTPLPAASIEKFTAKPESVASGVPVKLSWKTVGTTNCNLFDVTNSKTNPKLVKAELPSTGSYSVTPLWKDGTFTTVYRLRCQDASTQKDKVVEMNAAVDFKMVPQASIEKFMANPTVVERGTTKLSWATVGTSNCNIFDVTNTKVNPNLVQSELPSTGSFTVYPLEKYTSGKVIYRLRCQDASTQKDRVVESDIVVNIKSLPKAQIATFIATPAVIKSGTTKLSWVSTGTTNCSIFDVTNSKTNPNLVQPDLSSKGTYVAYPLEKYTAGTKVTYRLRCQDASTQKDRVVEADVVVHTVPSVKVLGASTNIEEVLATIIIGLEDILARLKK